MKTQFGKVITGDFSENTITIEIEGEMVVKAGDYALVPMSTYKSLVEKPEKQDIETRKANFMESMRPYVNQYPEQMLQEFYNYWTEHGPKDRKFRMEKQTSWNLSLRLQRWYKKSGGAKKQVQADVIKKNLKGWD